MANKKSSLTKRPSSVDEFRNVSKFNKPKDTKGLNGKYFQGQISDGQSKTYIDRTPGLFVQSIKGMEGKHYIEAALNKTILDYMIQRKYD